MRFKHIVILAVVICVALSVTSCIPWLDRPATVYVTYVDRACVVTAVNSAGDEMDPLELWPGRVVHLSNGTDCVVAIEFPTGIMNRKKVRLNPGKSAWVRVKRSAAYGGFDYTVECCVVPGSSGGSAGPRGQVDDDDGGP